MPDKNFFKRGAPLTLSKIVELSGSTLAEGANSGDIIEDVAPLDMAGAKDVSFLDNKKYKEQFATTKAGACFVSPDFADLAPEGVTVLLSENPYKSYALTAQAFYPAEASVAAEISDQAYIAKTAKVPDSCRVESGAYIGDNVKVGENCIIEANAVIRENVQIGDNCRIGANATVSHALIGHHVNIYTGVRIGQDGFGFAIDPAGHVKVPQLGRVLIEDHVEVGANTTIDRGAGPDTVIGQGTWIDNLVQIGHNAKIGKGCVIVAHVGISGSTVIEDFVSIGGQVGVAGHLRVGKGAQIGAQSGVMRDVPPGERQVGTPAVPEKQFFRQVAALNRLINKKKSS